MTAHRLRVARLLIIVKKLVSKSENSWTLWLTFIGQRKKGEESIVKIRYMLVATDDRQLFQVSRLCYLF